MMMNEVPLKLKTQHVIEMFDKEKNQKKFLILNNDEWQEISQDEYNKLTRGEDQWVINI